MSELSRIASFSAAAGEMSTKLSAEASGAKLLGKCSLASSFTGPAVSSDNQFSVWCASPSERREVMASSVAFGCDFEFIRPHCKSADGRSQSPKTLLAAHLFTERLANSCSPSHDCFGRVCGVSTFDIYRCYVLAQQLTARSKRQQYQAAQITCSEILSKS